MGKAFNKEFALPQLFTDGNTWTYHVTGKISKELAIDLIESEVGKGISPEDVDHGFVRYEFFNSDLRVALGYDQGWHEADKPSKNSCKTWRYKDGKL